MWFVILGKALTLCYPHPKKYLQLHIWYVTSVIKNADWSLDLQVDDLEGIIS